MSFSPPVETSDPDPFEAFNRAQGMGTVRDPYPALAALRAAAPVHRLEIDQISASPATATPFREVYLAVSYDAVLEVLRDARRFSSAGYAKTMGEVLGHTILEMDGQEHVRYRSLISRAFTRRALERWERDWVRPVIAEAVDAFAGRGSAELVRELTFPFPVRVVAGMLGLPDEDRDRFHRWAVELISIAIDPERSRRASREIGEYLAPLVAERRTRPRRDLISALAGSELEGTRLSDEQIFAFVRLLAPAGAETTYRSSSNLLYGLLSHPDQLERLRRDRGLIPQAIEEGLRWEPPLLSIMRTATEDTEVCGIPVPEGAPVAVNLGAANRDPSRWEEPERFDITRPPRPHLAFAIGRHVCLGMHLARLETRVLLETLLDRLPGLRLDPDAHDVHITGMVFRSPLELPVRYEVSA